MRLLVEERTCKADVRRKIAEGVAEADAGLLLDGEQVFERLRHELRGDRGNGG